MANKQTILIKNVYWMLSYVYYKVLKQKSHENVVIEDFQDIENLYAMILSAGVAQQLKQGLFRHYITKNDSLLVLRGKLDLPLTIKNRVRNQQDLACEFDELSENNLLNQIIKTTMQVLIAQQKVEKKFKDNLKKELLFFSNIDSINPFAINWNQLHFHRHNQTYEMLINICHMILDGLIQTTENGVYKMRNLIDEKNLHTLYEKFILEYYQRHYPMLKAEASHINWALDNDFKDYLPSMKTDVTLTKDNKTLIIDAKYYSHIYTSNHGKESFHSANLYQIFSYVKNYQANNTNKKVAGMLLYAKTRETVAPDNSYNMTGNIISVETLDLNVEFTKLAEQLDTIAKDYFEL